MIADVFHHTNHFRPDWHNAAWGEMFRLEFLADRALTWPSRSSQQIVHDDHLAAVDTVLIVEEAAGEQLGSHGVEITRSDGALIRQQSRGLILSHAFWTVRSIPVRIIVERKMRYRSHRFHPRE